MPKSIAGAYAVAGVAIAVAIIVVASSTVGLFGSPPTTGAVEAAAQPATAQSAQAFGLSTGTAAEGIPAVATESGEGGEREHEEHEESEEREHTGFRRFFRGGDD